MKYAFVSTLLMTILEMVIEFVEQFSEKTESYANLFTDENHLIFPDEMDEALIPLLPQGGHQKVPHHDRGPLLCQALHPQGEELPTGREHCAGEGVLGGAPNN